VDLADPARANNPKPHGCSPTIRVTEGSFRKRNTHSILTCE
jgi:hypothetical protein